MKKLNHRYFRFINSTIMSLFMSLVMSFAITVFRTGWTEQTLHLSLKSWCLAFPIAFIVAQVSLPVSVWITAKIVE